MRGDSDSNIYYATKLYNKCEKHKKNGCKCHYSEIEDYRCEICNDKCPIKTKSKIDGISNLVGPFKFGSFQMSNLEMIREKNKMMLEDMKRLEKIRDEMIPYEEIVMNPKKYASLGWMQTPNGYLQMEKDRKRIKKEKRGGRFWRPVLFYFYGPGGSGKTGLIMELFRNELYDKPEKGRSGTNFWNGYSNEDIVLLDEFYTKIDWETGTGKTHYCRNFFNEEYIQYDDNSKSLQVKWLKEFNVRVIDLMITPRWGLGCSRMREPFFKNKFNPKYIKFVFLESVHEMERYKEYNIMKENIDYVIRFNGKYNHELNKPLYEDGEEKYVFEKGSEEELKRKCQEYRSISSLFEIRIQAINSKTCEECTTLRENCRKEIKPYNKGLSLVKNIARIQKDLDETNKKYNELNTKYIQLKEKYGEL
ncbi:8821_t:CDS:2 [Cetraspora pellucida]|uniref:8821_t:CDS:1 n=1 Tax=Cetraspora pellucida TaxID=1433469 RepID=A0A9N8YS65_9GLOM|nr:8821_t:CDS:2 [Cetraspora pellucida]